jgi:hypothetical protein
MGLSRKYGPIAGMMRAAYYSVEQAQQVRDTALAPLADQPHDVYKTNIQISELNALSARNGDDAIQAKHGFLACRKSGPSTIHTVNRQ